MPKYGLLLSVVIFAHILFWYSSVNKSIALMTVIIIRDGKFGLGFAETEMSSCWRNLRHWLHRKLSPWQLLVYPVTKFSSKWWHRRFGVCGVLLVSGLHCLINTPLWRYHLAAESVVAISFRCRLCTGTLWHVYNGAVYGDVFLILI